MVHSTGEGLKKYCLGPVEGEDKRFIVPERGWRNTVLLGGEGGGVGRGRERDIFVIDVYFSKTLPATVQGFLAGSGSHHIAYLLQGQKSTKIY